GGLFVMYNYFRQGWLVARLNQGLEEVFGKDNPAFLCLPSTAQVAKVKPDTVLHGYFTAFFAGGTDPLKQAFAKNGTYDIPAGEPPGPNTPNGFVPTTDEPKVEHFQLSQVVKPKDLLTATDDWPFLYLRQPTIPDLSLRGAAIMGGIAVLLLLVFVP